jgi:tetratricopeptide (TPR) repeat protein
MAPDQAMIDDGRVLRSPRLPGRSCAPGLPGVLALAVLFAPATPVTASQAPTPEAATSPPASAAPSLEQAAEWEAALQHIERGKRGDPDGFYRCGETLLAIHSRLAADDARVPTALFKAGQCFAAAGLWGAAAQVYERLLAGDPQGKHSQRVLHYLVLGNFAVARYEDAARQAERYAALYPKDEQVQDHLRRAYQARLALGQRAQALAALAALEALFNRKDPERAAGIFWSRRALLTSDDERLKHAMAYLEVHGKRGGHDRRVVAEATIGQLLWRRACAKGLHHDLCAALGRGRPQFSDMGGRNTRDRLAARRRPSPPPPPPTCRELSMPNGSLYPRAQKDTSEGQRYFASALQLARRQRIMIPEDALERRREFADAVAMASVYLADRGFEELLAVLGALSDAPDLKPVPELLARAAKLAGELEQRYAEVIADETSIYWSIAAAARIGQIAETRADALLRREVPRAITGKLPITTYCGMLREQAAPLYAAADAAYERCLERSIATGTFSEFSQLCEEALNWRDPARFPRTPEYINKPVLFWSRPDVVGVQLEAPPDLTTANEPQ